MQMNLKRFFDSELHKKIIRFFYENPASIDTPRGIATWVGSSREEAKKVLDELVKAGILCLTSTSSTSGYSLTQDKKIIDQLGQFFNA
jgi:predicted HTH transcriptional regulator